MATTARVRGGSRTNSRRRAARVRPAWVLGLMSGAAWAAFCNAIIDTLEGIGATILEEGEDAITFRPAGLEGIDKLTMALEAPVKVVARRPIRELVAITSDYVRKAIDAIPATRGPIDPAAVRAKLATDTYAALTLARPFAGDLRAVVVVDRPTVISYPGVTALREATGLDDDALFALAMGQLRDALKVTRVPVQDAPFPLDELVVAGEAEQYGSSAALLIDELGFDGEAGVLAVLPCAEAAYVSQLGTPADAWGRIGDLVRLAAVVGAPSPHPLPRAIYCWRRGSWTAVRFELSLSGAGTIALSLLATEELIEALGCPPPQDRWQLV